MAVDPRQIQLLEEALRGMSLDQILTAARPATPIQTGVVPGQQPRGVAGNIMDRFADSGLPEIPGTLADIGRNAFPNVESLNAAFASGQPEPQGIMSRMFGAPPQPTRPQGGAPDFLREGNFGQFSEADRALFNPLAGTAAARAASYTPFGVALGTNPVSEAALSLTGPAVRMGSKIVGGGLDLLGLGIDAGKAVPATFGQEEPLLGDKRSKERLGREGIPFDLPKYVENIRDEQKIKEEGGRGGLYLDTMLKKWEEPGYIEALQAEGGTNEEIAKEMSDELAFAGITGDWTDFISDILLLEGAARTPQVLAKIAKNSRRVQDFGLAKAKREVSLMDRAGRKRGVFDRGVAEKNVGQVERAGQVAKGREIAASDEVGLQAKLKQKWEQLGGQQKREVGLRKGPTEEVSGLKGEIAANVDVAGRQAAARKLQAEGGAQGMFGRKLEQQAGEKAQGVRKLFGKSDDVAPVEAVAKPSPKKKSPFKQKQAPAADDKAQAVKDAVAKVKAGKKAQPEKIIEKPSVSKPSTEAPADVARKKDAIKEALARVERSKAGNKIKQGGEKAAKKASVERKIDLELLNKKHGIKLTEGDAANVVQGGKINLKEFQAKHNLRLNKSEAESLMIEGKAKGRNLLKGKKKIEKPVVKEAPAPAAEKPVQEMSDTELLSKMAEDLGVGLSTKDPKKLKKADDARKAAFREYIKRFANPSEARKAIMDGLKVSAKTADEIIAKGTAAAPGAKTKAPSVFGAKAASEVVTGEGAVAKVIAESKTPLETVTSSIVRLARTEKKFVQTEAIDDASRALRSIGTAINKPKIFGKKQPSKVITSVGKKITRKDIKANPDKVYLFGDNLKNKGLGGQAAEFRGEPNAIGIPTKKAPSNAPGAFFTDAEFAANKKAIDAAFSKVPIGTEVVVPELGAGRAQLASKAPKTFDYLQGKIKQLSVPRSAEKVTPKALVASLEAEGMSNKEIVNVLTKLNTPAAGSSRVFGAASQGDDFVKSALKIATGKKQPATVIKEPFTQNILEKAAAKNVAKPSVRGATTKGDIGTFGPDVGKPVPKAEEKYNPFKRRILQDKEQFKKTSPFTGKSTSKAEALSASQTPARPQAPQTKKGAAVGSKDLPGAKPTPRVDTPSIKKVMKGEVSYDEYRTFKKTQQAERKAAMDVANKKKAVLEKKYDTDKAGAQKRAKEQALYDDARSKESQSQARARAEETNYYTEQAMKKEIKQELHDLRLQLKRVERASGRGVAAKKRPIQKRIDALVRERENISTIQRTRVGKLAPTASKDEIRFQTLIDAERSLKDQLKTATSALEKEDLRLRIAAFKVEQDSLINQLAGSKQFVAEAEKLTIKEAMRDIKETFKAKTRDTGLGLSTKDVSGEEIKRKSLIKLAQAKAREYKRNEVVREMAVRAQRAKQPIEEFVKTVKGPDGKGLSIVARREIVRRVQDNLRHLEHNSKIGNFQLGRMVAKGDLEPEIAEVFSKVYAESPHLFDSTLRKAVGNQAVRKETYNMTARKVGKQFFDLNEAEMASMYSMPMSDAIMMTNKFIEGEIPEAIAIDTVRSLLINYDRGGATLGRALNARKGLFKYEQLIADVRKMGAKGMTTKEAEASAMSIVEMFAKYRKNPTKFQQVYDIYQEYSVNNILGAGVTFSRNLVGATTEVFINQPKERIMRAMLQQTVGRIPGVVIKDPVSLREILPEVKALYHNLPSGMDIGARFALRGTTRGVLNSMTEELKWLEKMKKGQPRWVQRQIQKRSAWTLQRRASLLEIKANVRTGEVFTGKEGSKIIELGAKLRDSDSALKRALGVGTQVGGVYINTPVRGLLAADAILQESSYQGHKAATRWRRASRVLRGNKGSKIRKEKITEFKFGKKRTRTIKNVVGKDGKVLLKDIAGGPLSKADQAEAMQDALVYMYRAPFKSKLGKVMEKALRHRGANNIFLFMKTRTNILKAALARNPITGMINVTAKSTAATIERNKLFKGTKIVIDGKSMGKLMNGMATMMFMKWQAEKMGGRYVGPSKDAAERQRRLQQGLSELYYEHVKGDPSKGVSDLSNMSPLTAEAAQLAAWTRFEEELKMGKGKGAASMNAFKSFVDAMRQDSMYSDVEGITRFVQGTMGKGADPNIPFGERLSISMARTISSRVNPNRGRETRQSGKFLGVPVSGLTQDNTVLQPDSGKPLTTLKETLLHDRFSQMDTSDVGRKKNVLTGENIERSPRYSPRLINVLATLHPAFLPTKRIPDSHLGADELKVGKFLEDYDVGLPLPSKSASLGGEQLKLTIKEQNKFIELMTTKERGSMHGTVMKELLRLERRIRRTEGRTSFNFRQNRKDIQNKLRKMKTEVNKQILPDVTIRLYKTAAGRERLWSTLNHDKIPWKDDDEHRRKLQRIIRDANFWVGRDVRRLKIP